MIKNLFKTPYRTLFVLVCIIIVLTITPKREMLSPATGSGSGTTSGGSSWSGDTGTGTASVGSSTSGQAGGWAGRVYGVNGMLTSANEELNADYGRIPSTFKYCSPESHPHGCSDPYMSVTVPAQGPFPYYLK